MDELAFQVSRRMAKIAQDIEYTFINGKYAKATTDAEANQTRGLLTADYNQYTRSRKETSYLLACSRGIKVHSRSGKQRPDNIVLGVDATTMLQLNLDCSAEQPDYRSSRKRK